MNREDVYYDHLVTNYEEQVDLLFFERIKIKTEIL